MGAVSRPTLFLQVVGQTGSMAIESAGLIVKLEPGIYWCLHDQVATGLGETRCLHLVPI